MSLQGLGNLLRSKVQRISNEQNTPQQHLLSRQSLETLKTSVLSFRYAATSPYVIDKLKRYIFRPSLTGGRHGALGSSSAAV